MNRKVSIWKLFVELLKKIGRVLKRLFGLESKYEISFSLSLKELIEICVLIDPYKPINTSSIGKLSNLIEKSKSRPRRYIITKDQYIELEETINKMEENIKNNQIIIFATNQPSPEVIRAWSDLTNNARPILTDFVKILSTLVKDSKYHAEAAECITEINNLLLIFENFDEIADDFLTFMENNNMDITSMDDSFSIFENFIHDNNITEKFSIYRENNNIPEYNTDMSESQAKKTLKSLSQSLINDFEKDKKITQSIANTYANEITTKLLPIWTKGFTKFKIILDDYQSFYTLEFITPRMTQDFVSRFINGKESLHGHLHRDDEIKIKMSPRIFHTMKDPDDAYYFFKSAIQYYDIKIEKVGLKLMAEVISLGHNMKHLIANTKLGGLVTYPLTLLFVFDDVNMTNRNTFKLDDRDVQVISKFVRNISSRYTAPEKEKTQIIDDVKKMVKELRESCEISDTIRDLSHLPDAIEKYYNNEYQDLLLESEQSFIEENIDRDPVSSSGQTKYIYEKFGVKKLKKIPRDIISYISIETEAIRDSNDKIMISSYCLGKIEIVEWYIELLEVGSKRYIVPHDKPYLETMRTQLLACFKKIMEAKVLPPNRPIIDIQYPKGYEG